MSRWTLNGVRPQRIVKLERSLSRDLGAHIKEWVTPEGKRYLKYQTPQAPSSVVLLGIQGSSADITIQLQNKQR